MAATPEGIAWPKVSIVTVSFNHGGFIEECIRSVLLQGYPNLEYIIIDGGSTDGTVAIIQKYAPWLSNWASESDSGPLEATNKGFRRASGDLYGIMCTDDSYLPGGIWNLVQLRQANPTAVAWLGACPEIDSAGKMVSPGVPYIRDPRAIGVWGEDTWFNLVGSLFASDAFHAAGALDTRFKNACDIDLFIRFFRAGTFVLTNLAVATVRHRAASVSRQDPTMEWTAVIASNYIHGFRETAKAMLVRYGKGRADEALWTVTPERLAQLKLRGDLFKALLYSLRGTVRRRLFGRSS